MLTKRQVLTAVVSGGFILTMPLSVFAQTRTGDGAAYQAIVDGAKKEGKVTIYTSTDLAQVRQLLDGFRAAHPGVTVDYQELGTNQIYNRVISEAAAKQDTADIVWSPAMDQQIQLATSGLAATYESPEKANLPSWAIFRNQVYATSLEPIAIVYNKKLLPAEWVPKTYQQMITLIKEQRDALKGKLSNGDPEKSGTAFMIFWNDARNRSDFWDLQEAFGAAQGQVYAGSGNLREKVISGENLLGIGALGPYALQWAKENPTLGVTFLSDYTPAFGRVALINKAAPHPNAARLFLDYMVSRVGQEALASGGGLPSVRSDTTVGENAESIKKLVGGEVQPIVLDETLLELQDQQKRLQFLQRWKKAMKR
jgi:iron(III) transport system substrate-binding protein